MTIHIDYPHWADTAEPLALNAPQIWTLALHVRRQIVADPMERRTDVGAIVERAAAWCANGICFEAYWDLEHRVKNEAGHPVMGITEFDAALPTSIMVSVNGVALGGRDDLLRSTAAHELGHVVFEAPGWIAKASGQRSAGYSGTVASDEAIAASINGKAGQRLASRVDPREVRANEFMGAFLTPPNLLKLEFLRLAKRLRLPSSSHPSRILRGAPAFDVFSIEPDAAEDLVFDLAERFGVSQEFVRVRLSRYDLLRSRAIHG